MSQTTITFVSRINGALVDLDSIFLADESTDFGVKRIDNNDVVVAYNTVVPRISLGTYQHTFTDPEPGLTYEYTVKLTYAGVTYYYNRQHMAADINNLVLIPTTAHYTSQAEVYRMMGEYAAQLMIEDYAGEDKGYIWENILDDVDETIKMYLMQHYDVETNALSSVQWVRRRATVLAANFLSQRRGNAPLFVARTERTYEELNQIRDGRFRIPGAHVKHFQGPVVRNYQVQNRFYYHPSRVESSKSTGDSYSRQDVAYEPIFFTLL